MQYWELITVGIFVWNFVVFLVYAADKQRVRRKQWRVAESVLLTLAFAGGGLGALLGMVLMRHKTRHVKFRILIPVALVLQAILALIIIF